MDKKEIIKLLEQHFGVKAKYMGTPSFAHQIKAGEEIYTITRNGNIEDFAGRQIDLNSIICSSNPENQKADSFIDAERDITRIEITLPLAGHTGISLKNMVNMIYSKQNLIQKALNLQENLIDQELVTVLNEKKPETAQDFKELLLEVGNDKCPGISFDIEEGLITFKLGTLSPEQIKACSELFALISESAKTLKHASSKQRETDNEKYAFRTWLLRLGMIGAEYQDVRKTILARLEGNGAFRIVNKRK